jgi:hypothetical protein
VIWAKTDAGRREIIDRALVKERARRNLLLVIDGVQSEEALTATLAGIGADDFRALEAQGLIAPASGSVRASSRASTRSVLPVGRGDARPSSGAVSDALSALGASTSAFGVHASALSEPAGGGDASGPAARDPAMFAAKLTRLISNELGLRGFVLSLAVERATTPSELEAIAQRTLDQIRERRGEAACAAARQTLYGA